MNHVVSGINPPPSFVLHGVFSHLLAAGVCISASATALAFDPVAGKQAYDTYCQGCHGANPATNINKIQNGANNGAKTMSAISGNTGGMGYLAASVNLTMANNMGAYIANPASGTPPAAAPVASASLSSLSFASTQIGAASSTQSVTLSNTGTAALAISGVSVTGAQGSEFIQTGNCSGSVAAGASCSISVSFAPTASGARSGTLVITHNASGGSTSIGLSGTGAAVAAPVAAVDAAALNFGSAVVGAPAAAQSVTLSNTGTASMSINSISASGDFARSGGTCGTSLPAGANCTVGVVFTPTVVGARTGGLSISTNAATSPAVSLSGTGTAVATPAISLSASSLAFGSTTVGTAAVNKTLTVTNTGSASLQLGLATASAGFSIVGNGCTAAIAPAATCTITLGYTPDIAGSSSGTLQFTSNAAGSPHNVALSGSGVAQATGTAAMTPTSISFANTAIGQISTSSQITLQNTGAAAYTLSGILVGGVNPSDFAIVSGGSCVTGATVSPGASCTLQTRFAPTTAGQRTASLYVTTSSGSTVSATLSGQGEMTATLVSLTPARLDFGREEVGEVTGGDDHDDEDKLAQIRNTSSVPVTISSIAVQTPFTVSPGSCGSTPFTLQPGQDCSVTVRFAPTVVGAVSNSLLEVSSASGVIASSSLSGTATQSDSSGDDDGGEDDNDQGGADDDNQSSGGGGGCTVGTGSQGDISLPLMTVLAGFIVWLRRRVGLPSK